MRSSIVVRLPEVLNVQSFEDAVLAIDPPQGEPCSAIFDYTHVRFAPFEAHVHMLGLCNRLLRAGASVELWWPAGAPRKYAQTMGFFEVLDSRIKIRPARPGPRDSYLFSVPLAAILPDDREGIEGAVRAVHEAVRDNCLGLRQAEDIAGHVWTVAAELVQNMVDWSATPVPGIIGLQGYRDRISICIADSGVGITGSIREHQAERAGRLTDKQILLQVFRDGLSSRTEPGGGAGLTRCAEIAGRYDGRLSVRTGRSWAKLIVKAKRTDLTWELFEANRAHIDGTIICLDLLTERLVEREKKQKKPLDTPAPPS